MLQFMKSEMHTTNIKALALVVNLIFVRPKPQPGYLIKININN